MTSLCNILFIMQRRFLLPKIKVLYKGGWPMKTFKRMKEDMDVVFSKDPAARTYFEVFLTYSGIHAIWLHRIAHLFFKGKFYFIARAISQMNRFFTGIEIHPGAKIGRRLFIDHGMGIVIGETCEIGDDAILYQGVTLGGTGQERGKRHPTLKDNATIYSGAKILGAITIGEHSIVGAGSVVLKDVPDHSTAVGVPARIAVQNGQRIRLELDQDQYLQKIVNSHEALQKEIDSLRQELNKLKGENAHVHKDL